MPDPLLYLRAMVAAAIVSASFVLAIIGLRRPSSAIRRNSAAVLGTGLGITIGCGVMSLRFAWPPVNGLDRLFVIIIPSALKRTSPSALIGIGVVGLFGVLFIGRFFGRLSTGCTVVILLAPLLCWVSETPLLRHRKPWFIGSVRLLLVAIPLAAVLALAKLEFDQKMAPLL